ncbi:hypothetical protein P12x_005482 [Tundrisphaera lichenicola]|uniref:hypothetical protein n=1 Tax=Tundrisphaera lichenicola TaxID=2029860 RepID=UPI003EBBAD13
MMSRPFFAILAVSACFAQSAIAQIAPPMIRSTRPIGAAPGETVTLEGKASEVRDGATLRFDDPTITFEGLEIGKAEGNGLQTIKVRVTVPMKPGPFGFRIATDGGISNPGQVLVGRPIPTVAEVEPNDRLRQPQAVSIPSAIEGTVSSGDDVDVFAVEMQAGETLVAEAVAARAGSKLDAWVAILSADGRELAADDDRFGRDAAAWSTVPTSGRYLVTIQDANGRHRDGGIESKMTRPYRLEVGRFPIIDAPFPAGAKRGRSVPIRLLGANLPEGSEARFDPPPDAIEGDHPFTITTPLGTSNALAMRVGGSDEVGEIEPNEDIETSTTITVPASINGTFGTPDASGPDLDIFRLKAGAGRAGDYAISVLAARVGSPGDPILTVLDPKGEPQGEDDDKLGRDARIERPIESNEGILISVRDYFGRGGDRFVYRIEVEPVLRNLAVSADLGHRTVPRSGSLAVPITVERNGFAGPVTILAGDLPEGILARPLTIGPDDSGGLLVFSASTDAAMGAFPIRLTARDIPAPAAFSYRERGAIDEVPRENDPIKGPHETVVDVTSPLLAVADRSSIGLIPPEGPIVVTPGGSADLKFAIDRRDVAGKKPLSVRLLASGKALEGFEPVKDLDVKVEENVAAFTLKAKVDAKPRSVTIAARARIEGTPEGLGADSSPVILVVPDRAGPSGGDR